MPIPGQENQEGGQQFDALNRMNQFPNPNGFLLRNIFGTQNLGWSNGAGAGPFSYNFANAIVPGANFGIPWVPGPQMGWSPTNLPVNNFGGGFGDSPTNGTNGANGVNGSNGSVIVSYYTGSGDVTVDPANEIYFDFPDGYVTDDGNGKVTVTSPSGGAVGTLTATVPLTGGGNMSSNRTVGLSYDNTDSFQLSAGTTLQLKNVTVTAPSDAGAVTGITTDNYGRVTTYARQFHGIYKITGSTFASPGHWGYSLIEQTPSGSFPFFTDASNTITAYNLLETSNTSSLAYGLPAVGTASPIELTSQDDYKMYPVPTNLRVEVWKWGSNYFFSAPNKIDGVCP